MATFTWHQVLSGDQNWERLLWGMFRTDGPAPGSTVTESTTTRYVLQGAAASGLFAGWTLTVEPSLSSTANHFVVPSDPALAPSGRIDRFELRDAQGALVLTVTSLFSLNIGLDGFSQGGRSALDGNDTITGTVGDDVLIGGAGNDTLRGGAGTDTLIGGAGGDTYILDDLLDIIVEDGPAAIGSTNRDRVHLTFSTDYTIPDAIEEVRYIGLASGVLTGGAGDDRLLASTDTGAGFTTLIGGAGNDYLALGDRMVGGYLGLEIVELAGGGVDTVEVYAIDYALGANVENLVWRTTDESRVAILSGNASANVMSAIISGDATIRGDVTLLGEGGNDVLSVSRGPILTYDPGAESIARLYGGAGDDRIMAGTELAILDGGTGVDTLSLELFDPYVGTSQQRPTVSQVDLAAGSYWSSVSAFGSSPMALYRDATGQISGFENVSGTLLADLIAGDAGANVLQGRGGDDHLQGRAGNDTLEGGDGDDRLEGGDGNDILRGGAGIDTLIGGAGSDTYILDDLLDIIIDDGPPRNSNQNRDKVQLTFSTDYVLPDVIEDGEYVGMASGVLTGNALDNSLFASLDPNAGPTTLIGGEGNDTLYDGDVMIGGVGNDHYIIGSDLTLQLIEYDGEGIDRISVEGIDYALPEYFENLTFRARGHEARHLSGNAADNVVMAYDSVNTTIHGFDGNDALYAGGSIYGPYDPQARTVARLYGGDGDDTLSAAANTAILDGGAGVDTVTFGAFAFGQLGYLGAHVDLALGFYTVNINAGIMPLGFTIAATLTSIENVTGTALGDIIGGDAGANLIRGGDGIDQISGRAGDDTLHGDADHDWLYGGAGLDTLLGGDGDDVLVGDDGFDLYADVLDGGAGNDVLHADASDTVQGGAGYDRLISVSSHAWTLDLAATSIEYAVLDFGDDVVTAVGAAEAVSVFTSGGNDRVTGSAFDDLIFGGVGDDILEGGDGDDALVGDEGVDQLDGGAGNDRLYFDAADTVTGGSGYDAGYIAGLPGTGATIDMAAASLEFLQDLAGGDYVITGAGALQDLSVYAGSGADEVTGSAFRDILWGEAGDDRLSGGDGDDVLVGGAGADRLSGGLGQDALYGGAGDNAADVFVVQYAGDAHADAVYDFAIGQDKLDISALAADFLAVTLTDAGGSTVVRIDGQQVATIVGVTGLTASDFIMGAASDAPLIQPAVADSPLIRPDPGEKPEPAQVRPGDAYEVSGVTFDTGFSRPPGPWGLTPQPVDWIFA